MIVFISLISVPVIVTPGCRGILLGRELDDWLALDEEQSVISRPQNQVYSPSIANTGSVFDPALQPSRTTLSPG
jgi:hypothetical protein